MDGGKGRKKRVEEGREGGIEGAGEGRSAQTACMPLDTQLY